jgi:hypothetical protein
MSIQFEVWEMRINTWLLSALVVELGLGEGTPSHDLGNKNTLEMPLSNYNALFSDSNWHTKRFWKVWTYPDSNCDDLQIYVVCYYSWLCLMKLIGLRSIERVEMLMSSATAPNLRAGLGCCRDGEEVYAVSMEYILVRCLPRTTWSYPRIHLCIRKPSASLYVYPKIDSLNWGTTMYSLWIKYFKFEQFCDSLGIGHCKLVIKIATASLKVSDLSLKSWRPPYGWKQPEREKKAPEKFETSNCHPKVRNIDKIDIVI